MKKKYYLIFGVVAVALIISLICVCFFANHFLKKENNKSYYEVSGQKIDSITKIVDNQSFVLNNYSYTTEENTEIKTYSYKTSDTKTALVTYNNYLVNTVLMTNECDFIITNTNSGNYILRKTIGDDEGELKVTISYDKDIILLSISYKKIG